MENLKQPGGIRGFPKIRVYINVTFYSCQIHYHDMCVLRSNSVLLQDDVSGC
jgi:hypothetical protein